MPINQPFSCSTTAIARERGRHSNAPTSSRMTHGYSGTWRYVREGSYVTIPRAALLVEQYLKDGGSKLTEDNRNTALQTQAALRAYYSLVSLNGAPAGSSLTIDGEALGTIPLGHPVSLDLGQHAIRIEATGYQPFATSVDVPGTTEVKVDVAMTAEIPRAHHSVYNAGMKDLIRVVG